MKKKLLAFSLTICILISFIACGEAKAPVITDANSSPETVSSAFETGNKETASGSGKIEDTFSTTEAQQTETASESIDEDDETQSEQNEITSPPETIVTETETGTAAEPSLRPYVFINIPFPNVRDMINKLKNGEVDVRGAWYVDDTWFEIDFDTFYELTNLPEGYHDTLVEWSGKNSYMIYYSNDKFNTETYEYAHICFEPVESKEKLKEYMYGGYLFGEENFKLFSNIRTVEENTKYGVMTVMTFDTRVKKDLVYKRVDSYNAEGDLSFVYAKIIYHGEFPDANYLFVFNGEIPYAIIYRGEISLESMLSLKPVKVTAD